MRISAEEQAAIKATIEAGQQFGFGNPISHLQTAWAAALMHGSGFDEVAARVASGGRGYPFLMQRDLIERGEWDETGARYRTSAKRRKSVQS